MYSRLHVYLQVALGERDRRERRRESNRRAARRCREMKKSSSSRILNVSIHVASWSWATIGLGNGMSPDGIKLLPKPLMTIWKPGLIDKTHWIWIKIL